MQNLCNSVKINVIRHSNTYGYLCSDAFVLLDLQYYIYI